MGKKYIVSVRYESDAERKRIEYLLEKWKAMKIKGITFLIELNDTKSFFEELFSKLEGDAGKKVKIYLAEEKEEEIEKKSKILGFNFKEERKVVEKIVEYILSKINAGYLYTDGIFKVYRVFSKKGTAELRILVQENNGILVKFEISGYGDVVDFIAEKITKEAEIWGAEHVV